MIYIWVCHWRLDCWWRMCNGSHWRPINGKSWRQLVLLHMDALLYWKMTTYMCLVVMVGPNYCLQLWPTKLVIMCGNLFLTWKKNLLAATVQLQVVQEMISTLLECFLFTSRLLVATRPIIITLPPMRHYHTTPTHATLHIAILYQMNNTGGKIG